MLASKSATHLRAFATAAASAASTSLRRSAHAPAASRPFSTTPARPSTSSIMSASARQRFMSTNSPTPPPPRPNTAPATGQHVHAQQLQQHPVWVRAFAKFANGKQPGQQGFWLEVAIIFTVFAVTGSSSLMVVRKGINQVLGVEGSLKDGPNSWRLAYVVFGLPMYSAILLTLGALSGRGAYFRMITHRMYGRILPKAWADKLKV